MFLGFIDGQGSLAIFAVGHPFAHSCVTALHFLPYAEYPKNRYNSWLYHTWSLQICRRQSLQGSPDRMLPT